MPNTAKDQLLTAINGSQQFQAKLASNNPQLVPDAVGPAHQLLAGQLAGLAAVCHKTAELVMQGYPAHPVFSQMCLDSSVDAGTTEKLASVVDALGEYLLEQSVINTYQQKSAEYARYKTNNRG